MRPELRVFPPRSTFLKCALARIRKFDQGRQLNGESTVLSSTSVGALLRWLHRGYPKTRMMDLSYSKDINLREFLDIAYRVA